MNSKLVIDWTEFLDGLSVETRYNQYFIARKTKSNMIQVFGWRTDFEKQQNKKPYWCSIEWVTPKIYPNKEDIWKDCEQTNILQYGDFNIMQLQYFVGSDKVTKDDFETYKKRKEQETDS